MPVSLSELLERIRPAGAPGAPTEGEQQRLDSDRDAEMAAIAVVLAGFENEAEAVITAATSRGVQTRRDADDQARQIRARLPDQLASAETAATERLSERVSTEQHSIETAASAAIDHLDATAARLIPEIRDDVVASIWSIVSSERSEGSSS